MDVQRILHYLITDNPIPAASLIRVSLVCKGWLKEAHNDYLWKMLCEIFNLPVTLKDPVITYRQWYTRLATLKEIEGVYSYSSCAMNDGCCFDSHDLLLFPLRKGKANFEFKTWECTEYTQCQLRCRGLYHFWEGRLHFEVEFLERVERDPEGERDLGPLMGKVDGKMVEQKSFEVLLAGRLERCMYLQSEYHFNQHQGGKMLQIQINQRQKYMVVKEKKNVTDCDSFWKIYDHNPPQTTCNNNHPKKGKKWCSSQ